MHAAKQAASLNTLKLIGFEDVKTNLWKAFYSNGRILFSYFFLKEGGLGVDVE
jgi:hypothetical protein